MDAWSKPPSALAMYVMLSESISTPLCSGACGVETILPLGDMTIFHVFVKLNDGDPARRFGLRMPSVLWAQRGPASVPSKGALAPMEALLAPVVSASTAPPVLLSPAI